MNKTMNWRLLKKLFAIHSPSGKEERMINFLISYLKTLPEVKQGKDSFGNLYARKGEAESYPCIVCHLDQVQHTHSRDFKAIETRDIIFGYSSGNHQFEGLGADDKVGIFIALEALNSCDSLKVVFFREEEIGCRGSSNCEMAFFQDCLFLIECDRKGNSDLITSIGCSDLCSEQFIRDIAPEAFGYTEAQGMMTDVEALKEHGLAVSAVNISCGYYNPHTDEEHVVKRDIEKCWRLVRHIIEDCTSVYPHEAGENGYFSYYDEWELEEEVHSILLNDPSMSAADLYELYRPNFPALRLEDFERMVNEHILLYSDYGPNEQDLDF